MICINYTFSQNLNGKYFEDSDYIEFKNDSAIFKISSNGGLIVYLHGTGTYKIINKFLLIKTSNYNGYKSYHEITEKTNVFPLIKVLDPESKPIMGVNITLIDKKGDFLSGTMTNENGQATFENNKNADKIKLALVGYDIYKIDYSAEYNYKIVLMDYETIENRSVVFKIDSLNSDALNLTLLSTDFKSKGEIKRDLIKLERKKKKHKFRERVFRKK